MQVEIDISEVSLETARLILKAWKLEDLDDFFEYASVDGVGERAGWSHHKNKDESLEILKMFIEAKNGFAITLKENNKVIGSLGIVKYKEEVVLDEEIEKLKGAEIGFVLSKDYWGQGLMTEAAKKVIDYCFNILKLDFLMAGYYKYNNGSKRVQEKVGFKYYKDHILETRYGTKEDSVIMLLINPNGVNKQ